MKDCAYAKAAYDVLINQNGYSEDQAKEAIETLSFGHIEKLTDKASIKMVAGLTSIGESLGLRKDELKQFIDESLGIIEGNQMTERIKNMLEIAMDWIVNREPLTFMAADALSAIHARGVEVATNRFASAEVEAKFEARRAARLHNTEMEVEWPTREQHYKFLPIELLGWHEAKNDLIFVTPALESIGVKISEEWIRKEYSDRASELLRSGDLAKMIQSGFNGYSKHWCPAVRDEMIDPGFINETLIPQLEEKGFAKDDEIRWRLGFNCGKWIQDIADAKNLTSSMSYLMEKEAINVNDRER